MLITLAVCASMLMLGAQAPVPSKEALDKARGEMQEVFGKEAAEAKTPEAKRQLAATLIDVSEKDSANDPAARYVLLRSARTLAAQAGEAQIGLKTSKDLAEYFAAESDVPASEFVNRGNELWDEGESQSKTKLDCRLKAAEWYYRAQSAAVGLQKTLIERRLAEVSADATVPQDAVDFEVTKATYGAQAVQLDVTKKMQNAIKKGQYTAFQGDWRVFGDPAPGKAKRFVVQCKAASKIFTFDLGDGDVGVVPLIPPRGIRVPEASPDFSIVAARWGAGMNWSDVTTLARNKIASPAEPFHASDMATPNDPWFKVHKHLVVWFDFHGTRYVRVIVDRATQPLLQPLGSESNGAHSAKKEKSGR